MDRKRYRKAVGNALVRFLNSNVRMTFSIRAVSTSIEINNSELSQIISKAQGLNSSEFVAYAIDDSEAGILVIEPYHYHELLFVQRIFVLTEFRGFGLGKLLLTFAEKQAQELGFSTVWLRPRPLDLDVDERFLEDWYFRQGYKWDKDHDHMEKSI